MFIASDVEFKHQNIIVCVFVKQIASTNIVLLAFVAQIVSSTKISTCKVIRLLTDVHDKLVVYICYMLISPLRSTSVYFASQRET